VSITWRVGRLSSKGIPPGQGALDTPDDIVKMIGVVNEVEVVRFDDEQSPRVISLYPVFIAGVQEFEVIPADALLIAPAAEPDLTDECVRVGAEVNEEVRRLEIIDHDAEQFAVVLVIPLVHVSHFVEVRANISTSS